MSLILRMYLILCPFLILVNAKHATVESPRSGTYLDLSCWLDRGGYLTDAAGVSEHHRADKRPGLERYTRTICIPGS